MTSKTVFIGLDGATFTLLDPLLAQGVMPFLKGLIATGIRSPLRTIVPPLTPPAWTSLLTGRSPGNHGIYDFFQLDAPGSRQIRLATSADVRCDGIGAIVNRHGKRITLLNFPVTFPPPPVDGFVVSGWMPWRQLRLGCRPPELYDRLKTLPAFNPRELAMDMALEARATEGCREDEYADWITLHMQREQRWRDVVRDLMTNDPTDLTAILLDGPDKLQHLCWRFVDPALYPANPTPEEARTHELAYAYYRQLDGIIEEIATLAGPDATIVLASDHGFGATTEVLHINSWLEQAGYLAWAKDAAVNAEQTGSLGMGHLSRHTQWLDWDRTTAYVSTPTSNGIHIVVADEPGMPGVPKDQYVAFRQKLIHDLESFTDPVTGERIISRVWPREEAFNGPAMAWAPDLTLFLRDGGLVSILPGTPILQPRPLPVGTHRPVGVFMAKGPGMRKGMVLRELSILDVAPTLLYSLGLPIPEDLEGRVPLEMFEPAFRSKRPVEIAPTVRPSQPAPEQAAVYDEESEEIILDRLRALGYVE